MDFTFDSEQNDLREAVRGLLERAYGDSEQRRRVTATDPGFDEKTWSRLAEMGLLGLPFAEEHGGMGAGPIEVAIVAEEIGRVLAPEPFVEAVVLAGGLVAAVGTDAQKGEVLAGIAEGTTLAAAAHAEPGTRWSPSAAAVTATQDGGSWTLSAADSKSSSPLNSFHNCSLGTYCVMSSLNLSFSLVSGSMNGVISLKKPQTMKGTVQRVSKNGHTKVTTSSGYH